MFTIILCLFLTFLLTKQPDAEINGSFFVFTIGADLVALSLIYV